jgi:hypothetical protein
MISDPKLLMVGDYSEITVLSVGWAGSEFLDLVGLAIRGFAVG